MEYLFQSGFFGTRAPMFMDIVFVIVTLLPLLVFLAILLAQKRNYRAHESMQKLLFFISLTVIAFFEYGVRKEGGYKNLMEGSSVSHDYLFYVLVFHIVISVITLFMWIYTLYRAMHYKKNKTLPGAHSPLHKKDGQRTFVGIVLTMLTGVWVYALLFVY